jgi:hypothetical protein
MKASMQLRQAASVISARFTEDGARLLPTTAKSATIWDATTGAQLYLSDNAGNQLADALLLSDGRNIFMGDIAFGDSYLCDMVTGRPTYSHETIQVQCASLVSRQSGILIASWDDPLRGAAQLLDAEPLDLRRSYTTLLDGTIQRVAVSGDEMRFLAPQDNVSPWSNTVGDDAVFLSDMDTELPRRRFTGPSVMYDVAFAPAEREVVASHETGCFGGI